MGHTPGDWTVHSDGYIQVGDDIVIAVVEGDWGGDDDDPENDGTPEQRANRDLIGAAPDLLDALEVLVYIVKEPIYNPEIAAEALEDARTATAKARGRTQ